MKEITHCNSLLRRTAEFNPLANGQRPQREIPYPFTHSLLTVFSFPLPCPSFGD